MGREPAFGLDPRDEHRRGLTPVRRRVWAPLGARPMALGHHRYKWLHVTAFVQPTTGEAVCYLSTGRSKPLFAALLAAVAQQTGAGRERHLILVLDNAGGADQRFRWRSQWNGQRRVARP